MFTWQSIVGSLYYEITFMLCAFLVGFGMPRRKLFVLRLLSSVIFLFGVMLLWRYITRIANLQSFTFFGLLGYVIYYLVMICAIFFSYRCNLWSAIYCATVGYCMEHFAERLFEVPYRQLMPDLSFGMQYLIKAPIFLISTAAIYFLLIRRSKYYYRNIMVDNKLQTVTSVIMVGIMIFINSFAIREAMGNMRVILYINIMSIVFSFTVIVLELGILSNKNREEELSMVKRTLQEERERYLQEKKDVELLNIMCHDLRHYLKDYEKSPSESMQNLGEVIDSFDKNVDLNNEALNVVLRKKQLECDRKNIRLSCMIDGARLGFIPAPELYSLFTNALDNAIAATEDLPPDKRLISITENGRGKLINLHVENYFAGEIEFAGGLPKTKKDTRYHGFGTKSMKYVAEKYGGKMRTYTSGDIFVLEILLPNPQEM